MPNLRMALSISIAGGNDPAALTQCRREQAHPKASHWQCRTLIDVESVLIRFWQHTGPSDFNIPQRFVASILYVLPFGKGERFLNRGGAVNQLVGGWQISTITTLQSGGAVDTSSWDSGGTNFISNATRLNYSAGVSTTLPGNNQNGWFNPAAFFNTAAGTSAIASVTTCADHG